VVDLVVGRVDDPAAGRLEDDRDRVRDRVGHAHELRPERADVDRAALGLRLDQLRAPEEAVLVELRLDEAERQLRAPDLGGSDLPEEVGKRADVVLVSVREDDGADVAAAVPQGAEVGEDEVDAQMLVPREGEARVDDHDPAVALDEGHVLPDLTETAERQNASPAHRPESIRAQFTRTRDE
jgi:hypothetical protein